MASSWLFLTYKNHPIKGIGSIRTAKLAKYLARAGERVAVLSTSNAGLFEQESYLDPEKEGIPCFRLATLDYQTIQLLLKKVLTLFRPLGRPRSSRPAGAQSGRGNKIFWHNLFNLAPSSLFFGQGGFVYILSGLLKGLSLVRKRGVTTVFSSFAPFSDHVIGWLLKSLRPGLFWIADFRDLPVSESEARQSFGPFAARMHAGLIDLLLKKADRITTVSEGLAVNLRQRFGPERIRVVRNGFDPEDFPIPSTAVTGRLTFFYAGAMYQGRRDPSPFLSALEELVRDGSVPASEILVEYAGRDASTFRRFLPGLLEPCFRDLGFLPRQEILVREQHSSCLLLLTWSSPDEKGILTGKLYEYIAVGRPILCLINGEQDPELVEILSGLSPSLCACSTDPAGTVTAFLRGLIRRYRDGKDLPATGREGRDKHSYPGLAKALIAVAGEAHR